MSPRGLASSLGEVAAEAFVEVVQRIDPDRLVVEGSDAGTGPCVRAQRLTELVAVLLRDAEQICDGQRRKGFGVLSEKLAATVADEFVELLVREGPQILLVLLQAFGSEEPAEQGAGLRVVGRIHRDDVLEDRELVTVRFDLCGDVVTFGGDERQGRERAADRVDRRERVGVLEGLHDLLVAGDDHHAVVRFAEDRVPVPQVIEVPERILRDLSVGEVVD